MPGTRLETHTKARESVLEAYITVTDVLTNLSSDDNVKGDMKLHARRTEMYFILNFWSYVNDDFQEINSEITIMRHCVLLQDTQFTLRHFKGELEKLLMNIINRSTTLVGVLYN